MQVRTNEIEAILSIFKEDADATTEQLRSEHTRLMNIIYPEKRGSVVAIPAGFAALAEPEPDLGEPEGDEVLSVVRRSSAAKENKEDGEATIGSQRRASQRRASQVSNTLLLRVSTLEMATSDLASALDKAKGHLSYMPKIAALLAKKGHISVAKDL